MFKGTLSQVLTEIAKQLSFNPKLLIQHAQEAPHAATSPNGNPWPSGTGSVNEKRILYAIARALNPMMSMDIGTRWGASTVQIVEGDADAPPPVGRVISIDIEKTIHGGKLPVGKFIPKSWQPNIVRLITSDCVKYLRNDDKFYELIFEDSSHTVDGTKAIYDIAIERLVAGGIIISHDACHPKFKGAVVAGIKQAGIEPMVYLVEDSACGLAIWQKPKKDDTDWDKWEGIDADLKPGYVEPPKVDREKLNPIPKQILVPVKNPTPPSKPKRKRRKKAAKKTTIEET